MHTLFICPSSYVKIAGKWRLKNSKSNFSLSTILYHDICPILPSSQRTVALWPPSPASPHQTAAWGSPASAQSILGKSSPVRWSIRPGGSAILTSPSMCKWNHCFELVWRYNYWSAVMQLSWCLHGSARSPQIKSASWCDAEKGNAKWSHHVGLQRSGSESVLQLLQVPKSCMQAVQYWLYNHMYNICVSFVFMLIMHIYIKSPLHALIRNGFFLF